MARYQYLALNIDRSEIRLVHLLPGKFEDAVEVELLYRELPEDSNGELSQLHYEALSYVWGPPGNPETNQTITVRESGGWTPRKDVMSTLLAFKNRLFWQPSESKVPEPSRLLSVGQNLGVALRHLRHKNKSRILWIDAICINQEDMKERSREVGRMGQIYRRAARVVIWLGPESDNSSLAIRTLQRFTKDLTDEYVFDPSKPQYRKEFSRAETLRYNQKRWHTENNLKGSFPAIHALLGRPWFTRLWVYQETQLATDGLVVAGFDTMPLTEFIRAACWFSHASVQILSSTEIKKLANAIDLIRPVGVNSVEDLIRGAKSYGCQDERDRIYALLALFPSSFRDVPQPDYESPVEEVYKQFFLAYMYYANLRILGSPFVRDSVSAKPIPSWIPDLSCPLYTLFYGAASHKADHNAIYSRTDNTLQVRGTQVANIHKVHDAVAISSSDQQIFAKCVSWEPEDLSTGKYRDGRPLLDAFVEALVGGATNEWWCFLPSVKKLGVAYKKHAIDGEKAANELSYNLAQILPGRTFFSASDGYIGICPPTALPGDIVCVVLGFRFPLVLHPMLERPGCFQMRGECYVPGLMRREALCGDFPRSQASGKQWTMTRNDSNSLDTYTDGVSRTQIDPRLPALPPGRVTFFRFGIHGQYTIQADEYDADGNMGKMYFGHEATCELELADPRMDPEVLRARGVDIQDIIIV